MNNENIKSSKNNPSKKLIITLVIILVSVIALNVIVAVLSKSFTRFDITSTNDHTLSDAAKRYLSTLDEYTTVYVLDSDGSDPRYENFLSQLDESSENVHVKWVSSKSVRDITDELGITEYVTPYFAIIVGAHRKTVVDKYGTIMYYTNNSSLYQLFGTNQIDAYNYEKAKLELYQAATSGTQDAGQYQTLYLALLTDTQMYFVGESAFCSTIEYVNVEYLPKRYYITGHGEEDFSKKLVGEYMNYYTYTIGGGEYNKLDTTKITEMPKDAVSVIMLHPKSDISLAEAKMFKDYIAGGGQMTFVTDGENLKMKNLTSVMEANGLFGKEGNVSEFVEVEDPSGATDENGEIKTETVSRNPVLGNINENYLSLDAVGVKMDMLTPMISNANEIELDNTVDPSLKLIPVLTTSKEAYIGDKTGERAARTIAAAAENKNGGSLLWFTGAKSFNYDASEMDSESEDGETADMTMVSNVFLLMSTIFKAPFTYESKLTSTMPKLYDDTLLTVSETNYILFVVVVLIVVAIIGVCGAILCYKRRKA